MLPKDIEIIRQAEDAVYDRDLQRQSFIRVEFFVGKHGPFVERFPKDGFTASVRDTKLMEFATHIRPQQ